VPGFARLIRRRARHHGLERNGEVKSNGTLFRAYGAVAAGANRPGIPGRFAPVAYFVDAHPSSALSFRGSIVSAQAGGAFHEKALLGQGKIVWGFWCRS
jgi:hypothetical protein